MKRMSVALVVAGLADSNGVAGADGGTFEG